MGSEDNSDNLPVRGNLSAALLVMQSFALGALLAGCSALLPRSVNVTEVAWTSFEEAQAAIESLTPSETRKVGLVHSGLDPIANPAITILTYSDIVQRFATGSAVRPEDLDAGIRKCLVRGQACTGFAINAKQVNKKRTGNFFLDALNFRRETETTGWTFNAIVLLVDDIVVYRRYGGQPRILERETNSNPLGPLQGWGESVGSALMR